MFKSTLKQIINPHHSLVLLAEEIPWQEFGKYLKIKETTVSKLISQFDKNENKIPSMIDKSFLSDDAKVLYKNNVVENYKLFRQK